MIVRTAALAIALAGFAVSGRAVASSVDLTTLGCFQTLTQAPTLSVLRMDDPSFRHMFLDGPTSRSKPVRARARAIAPGIFRFALSLAPGNYEIYAGAGGCNGQAMVVVLDGKTRSVAISLVHLMGFNALFDHDHTSVAGLFTIPGASFEAVDPSDTYAARAASVQDGAFYFDSLQRRPWILRVRIGSATADFPLDMSGVRAGDYATVAISSRDVLRRIGSTAKLFSSPSAVSIAPDGTVWFANDGRDAVGFIGPGGTLHEFAIPEGGMPEDLVATDDGAWYIVPSTATIGFVDRTGAFHANGLPKGIVKYRSDGPRAPIIDRSGTVWIRINGDIASITEDGHARIYALPSDPAATATGGLALDSQGGVWYDDRGIASVGRIAGGVATSYPARGTVPVGWDRARGERSIYFVALDHEQGKLYGQDLDGTGQDSIVLPNDDDPYPATDGSNGVWLSDCPHHRVVHVRADKTNVQTKTGADSCPYMAVADGAGGVWFIDDARVGALGHIDAFGVLRRFELPVAGTRPTDPHVASDGSVWFAILGSNDLGHLRDGHLDLIDLGNPAATPGFTIR